MFLNFADILKMCKSQIPKQTGSIPDTDFKCSKTFNVWEKKGSLIQHEHNLNILNEPLLYPGVGIK